MIAKSRSYIFLLCFLIANLQGQIFIDSVKVIPGPQYEAGWFHRFLFGDHWRDLWTTPITVPVLNLSAFAGGLTPLYEGGGMQTRSLRFQGNDGSIWKFRSMDKDPARVLPEDLKVNLVENIIQDQVSWANPYAPLLVTPMLNAANILQAEPIMICLPDDEKLGIFREKFAGMLGMIEIHPDEGEPSFHSAEKIINTYKLFDRLEEKRSEKVNSIEFLKARLMDVFFGDWDRHTDQWRWAKLPNGETDLWYPIPRDRDQAFAKFDGLLVRIAEYLVPQFVHFDEDYPQIEDITWSGRFLDRRFLTEISNHQWDSVAVFLKSCLTDELIFTSVKQLPNEQFEIAGDELIHKLKKRRDNFLSMADDYYYRINKYVDVYCSEENDYAEILRKDNNSTEVNIYKKSKHGNKQELLFHKTFNNNITQEIRVYLNNGDDKASVEGLVDDSPNIRVIGGKGMDELSDESFVRGYLFSFLPLPKPERKTYFYDCDVETIFKPSKSTIINTDFYAEPSTPEEKYEPKLRDRGHDWVALPYLNVSSDDGIVLGAEMALYSFDFRKTPYDYKMSTLGTYATKSNSYSLEFNGIFNSFSDDITLLLHVIKKEEKFDKYYGYGNETDYSSEREQNNYYRLRQELLNIFPRLCILLPGETKLELGLSYTYTSSDLENISLINNFPRQDYGMGEMSYLGLHSSVEIDTRDNEVFSLSGNYFKTSFSYYPNIFDIKTHFGQLRYDFRSYHTFNLFSETTMILRSGGGTAIGDFPVFGAMFLGGEQNLRGYNRDRFSGKSMLFNEIEFRPFLTEMKIILKAKIGLQLFGGAGRVFEKNDRSSKWHPGYGFGLWGSLMDRKVNGSVSLAFSPETITVYANASFGL